MNILTARPVTGRIKSATSDTAGDLSPVKWVRIERRQNMEKKISRRDFLQITAVGLATVAMSDLKGIGSAFAAGQSKSQVFFTEDISVNGLLKIYSKINQGMTGKIGIKLHTGEPDGQTYCQ